jgi:phosphatidylinositol N-acetylglucosaminyltransferase subunit Q
MVAKNGLLRIFWPSDAPRSTKPGVLVGWRNSDYDVVVISILQNVKPQSVDNALQVHTLYRNSPYPIDEILERCGKSPLQVLGAVNPTSEPKGGFNPASIGAVTSTKAKFPRIYCPDNGQMTVQILIYDRPNPKNMQYLSLSPISLALDDKTGLNKEFPPFDKIEAEEERERVRKRDLVEKLKLHTVVKHSRTPKELVLSKIVDQINCSFEVDALLQRNVGLIGTRTRRTLSVSERVVESASNLFQVVQHGVWQIATVWVYPVIAQLFILGLMAHRIVAEVVLAVLDWRLFKHNAALKDVSATAQQLDIRLQQFCYWPLQFMKLRKRNQTWQSITNIQPEYIRFYNSLWLVANDVILGIAVGSFIIENAHQVAYHLDRVLDVWTIDGLRHMIIWLMGWPAGLKLNTELATFLGDLFLWVIDYWAGCMTVIRPHLPDVIRFIGFSSFAGATMPISLFSDLASVLTLHIYAFYIASARIYNWQVSIIGSLFQLFRGKKINVLRKRIDSCDYDLDQLLLGTILFTLLTFLLPTVFVFYLTFASARMAIISLKAGLDTLLACLNHFPLFALMLRFKDSLRLPGGIYFELQDTPSILNSITSESVSTRALSNHFSTPEAPTSFIYLQSVPLPYLAMFHEYFQLGARIRQHYVSLGVIGCLVLGRFVPPIHRKNLYSLQYSMLPAQRIRIPELWNLLRKHSTDNGRRASLVNGMANGHIRIPNGELGGRSRRVGR